MFKILYSFKPAIPLLLSTIILNGNQQRPSIMPAENALLKIQQANLWTKGEPLRLHLGCGENHLNGYINIDFPPSEHTTQTYVAADIFTNITTLNFPNGSIDEVRSHHVFEHFDRPTALALLCAWHQWLKPGGTLVIETPDFDASIKILASSAFTYIQKQVTMRHIFGSHEAPWAIHCDGWYQEKFEHILLSFGFNQLSCQPIAHGLLIPAIIVHAIKPQNKSSQNLYQTAKTLLRESMVNDGSSENIMWQVWCKNFDQALTKMGYK